MYGMYVDLFNNWFMSTYGNFGKKIPRKLDVQRNYKVQIFIENNSHNNFLFCWRMRRIRWWLQMSGSSKYVMKRGETHAKDTVQCGAAVWIWLMFPYRNGMITSSAGTRRNTKMSPPSVFLQRSSGGPTLSSTTSEDLYQELLNVAIFKAKIILGQLRFRF